MKKVSRILTGGLHKTLSPLERKVVDILTEYNDLGFTTNYKVGPYYVDIAFPEYKVGLEIDGYKYHSTPEQRAQDELRQEYLEVVAGWKIERVPGWFCHRYPLAALAKALRHIPGLASHPLIVEGKMQADQWLARELLNEGDTYRAKRLIDRITEQSN